jgi:hypothetical protein
MDDTTNTESEWRRYAPTDAEMVDLEVASDLRHGGVYLLSISDPRDDALPQDLQKPQVEHTYRRRVPNSAAGSSAKTTCSAR